MHIVMQCFWFPFSYTSPKEEDYQLSAAKTNTRSIERNANEKQSGIFFFSSKPSDRNESINAIMDPNR